MDPLVVNLAFYSASLLVLFFLGWWARGSWERHQSAWHCKAVDCDVKIAGSDPEMVDRLAMWHEMSHVGTQ